MESPVKGKLYTTIEGDVTVLCTGNIPESTRVFSGVVVSSSAPDARVGKYCEHWSKIQFYEEPNSITITNETK